MADRAHAAAADNRRRARSAWRKKRERDRPACDAFQRRRPNRSLTAAISPPRGACFPARLEPFIDLSTGINPNPYPAAATCRPMFSPACRSRPRPSKARRDRRAGLWRAVSRLTSCRRPARKFCCRWSPRLVPPGRAAVACADAMANMARAAALAGHKVDAVPRPCGCGDARLVLVANPNNPDGRTFAAADLLDARRKSARARGGMLVVDEAFMDVGPPGASLAPESRLRQRRRAALVRQIFRPGRGAAWLRARRAAACGAHCRRCSVHGLCRDRRWRPARRRWPTQPGSNKTCRRLAKSAARLDATLAASGVRDRWRHKPVPSCARRREQTNCFVISAAPAFWCGCSQSIPNGSASGCRRMMTRGGD